MNSPLRHMPLGIRVVLMFFMFMFNLSVVVTLAVMVARPLFGIDDVAETLSRIPTSRNEVNAFLFLQACTSLGGFLLTAIMFSKLEAPFARRHLRLTTVPSIKFIALGIFAVLVAQFFIEFLVTVNSEIPMPPGIADYLSNYEKSAADITNVLLNFKRPGQFLFLSIVLALIPAVCEELFFRGLLLGDLLKAKISPWVAIPITGLVFALSHMEYQNTLAIWVLGSFLGYLYYISGSIWLPIVAHFVNNFLQVLLKYLFNIGIIGNDITDAPMPWYATIMAVLIFAVCIYVFNKYRNEPDFVTAEVEPATNMDMDPDQFK